MIVPSIGTKVAGDDWFSLSKGVKLRLIEESVPPGLGRFIDCEFEVKRPGEVFLYGTKEIGGKMLSARFKVVRYRSKLDLMFYSGSIVGVVTGYNPPPEPYGDYGTGT